VYMHQSYLPPDAGERAPPNHRQKAGTRLTYTPQGWKAELA